MYPQTPMRAIPPSFEVSLSLGYHCIRGSGRGRKVGSLPPWVLSATEEPGAVHDYLGIEYTPESLDEGPPEGPDLIWLENIE
ncbi:unnamed protein product [Boreogadus saida]